MGYQAWRSTAARPAGRTYQVRTYGCQMNVHDSERLAGLLEAAGYRRAADGADADVVVFNTCAVRENADNKLYGNLSHLAPRKQADPDMQIAVGGCLAQKDRDAVLRQGAVGRRGLRHPQHRVAADAAGPRPAQPRGPGRDRRGAAGVPVRRCRPHANPPTPLGFPSRWAATTPARSASCPSLRGKEVDRRPGDVLAEVQLAGRPGRPRGDPARAERQRLRRFVRRPRSAARPRCVRAAAARLRAASTGWSGSGSPRRTRPSSPTTSSRRWRRRRTSARPCTCRCSPARIACCGRCAGPTAPSSTSASSTGCAPPCRTPRSPPTSSSVSRARPRRTSQATLDVVRRRPVRHRVHLPVLQATRHTGRRARRAAAQSRCAGTLSAADRAAGADLARGEHRPDRSHRRAAGRHRRRTQGRRAPPGCPDVRATAGWCTSPRWDADIRPGDIVTTTVTGAAPHHLIADGAVRHHRRTRAGDAHAAGQRPRGCRARHARHRRAREPADRDRVCPVTAGGRRRRLRRVQGRHRGCRTPRRTGNRSRREGLGHRDRWCSCCC